MAGIDGLGGRNTLLARAYRRVMLDGDDVNDASKRFRDNRDKDSDGLVNREEF